MKRKREKNCFSVFDTKMIIFNFCVILKEWTTFSSSLYLSFYFSDVGIVILIVDSAVGTSDTRHLNKVMTNGSHKNEENLFRTVEE